MIRIIVRVDDACMAANAGGSVKVTHTTFDVSIPELESYLLSNDHWYAHANVIGVELLDNGRSDK